MDENDRGTHKIYAPGTAMYKRGLKMAEVSEERYHILCAVLQKKFVIRKGPPRLAPGAHYKTIDFSPYKEYKIEHAENVKLDFRGPDGSLIPEDLKMYNDVFEDDWQNQEAGILRAVAEYRDFFPLLVNFHSPMKTTGNFEWDQLFRTLQDRGYPKNIIPCMWFGRQIGCLIKDCPYLHDRAAVMANRKMVLDKRRATFDYKHKPIPRQTAARRRLLLDREANPQNYQRRDELINSGWIEEQMKGDRAYCAHPQCMKPWKEGEENPLKACNRCKFAMYCSRECQKADWQRHKAEPCKPIEELVGDDDLWSPIGTRKGTELINIEWGSTY